MGPSQKRRGGGKNESVGPVFLGFNQEIDTGPPLDRPVTPRTSMCTKNQPMYFRNPWLNLPAGHAGQLVQRRPSRRPAMPACLCNRTILHVSGESWGDVGRDLVIKDEDVCEVGGEKFFYITPHASRLVKFIAHGAPSLPGKLPKNMTLTSSVGLQKLLQARNLVAWPASSSGEALLFADVAAPPRKQPRAKAAKLQDSPTVTVSYGDDVEKKVLVKRPAHPCDRLAIAMNAESLENVFSYLRMAPFAEESAPKKIDDRVGVWYNKQRNNFMVPFVNQDGQKGRRVKCFKDVQEAMEAAAQRADPAMLDVGVGLALLDAAP